MADLLATNVNELRIKVAHELGFSRDPDSWSDTNKEWIEDCIVAGLRKFYWPDVDPQTGVSHVWSFMKPVVEFSTVADQWQYELPSEFAGIDGDLTFVTTTTNYYPIRLTSETAIRGLRQSPALTSGIPRLAATRPIKNDGTKLQRHELLLFPTPDAVYSLEYVMAVSARALTDAARYPYGGAVHADTIVESCLAVAEGQMNKEAGYHAGQFGKRMAVSVSQDSQLRAPSILGENRDCSDSRGRFVRRRTDVGALYNDVQY